MKTKICKICGRKKTLGEFHKHKLCKNGILPRCKSCVSIDSKNKYKRNKDKIKTSSRLYYENNKQKASESSKRHRELRKHSYIKVSTKKCSRCGKRKESKEFNIRLGTKYGLSSECTKCHNLGHKKEYQKNKSKLKIKSQKYRKQASKSLSDFYVLHLICGHKGLSHKDIPEWMLIRKREEIKQLRFIRKAQTYIKERIAV